MWRIEQARRKASEATAADKKNLCITQSNSPLLRIIAENKNL